MSEEFLTKSFFAIMYIFLIIIPISFLIIHIILKKSISEFLEVNNIRESTKKYSDSFHDNIKNLQHLVFFISLSFILAGFFEKDSISRVYALLAAILFIGAYIVFYIYNTSRNIVFFYWGLFVIIIAINLIFNSLGGITSIISNINDDTIYRSLGLIILFSFLLIYFDFLSKIPKNRIYKFILFWIVFLFTTILSILIGDMFGFLIVNDFIAFVLTALLFLLIFTTIFVLLLYPLVFAYNIK